MIRPNHTRPWQISSRLRIKKNSNYIKPRLHDSLHPCNFFFTNTIIRFVKIFICPRNIRSSIIYISSIIRNILIRCKTTHSPSKVCAEWRSGLLICSTNLHIHSSARRVHRNRNSRQKNIFTRHANYPPDYQQNESKYTLCVQEQ